MDTAVDLLELVARAQRGDEASIASLIAASAGRLRSVARSIVRDADQAEEATQRALIGIWQHLPSLRDPAAFEAWSYRLVVNACKAELRSARGRHQPIEDVEIRPSLSEDLAGPLETLADRDQLERAFARLPTAQRAVVALHHQHDLTLEGVASVLGIPVGTVWSRLHRAMDGLRAALAADARQDPVTTAARVSMPWVPARKARPWVPTGVRPAPATDGGRTIVVAQDGSGDAGTISAAVSVARDGDLVLVRPGIYRESVVVDRDIAIVGDGDREAIVLDFRDSIARTRLIAATQHPTYHGHVTAFGILLEGTRASVANLTVRGPRDGVAIVVRGGAPSILHIAGILDGIWRGSGTLRHFLFVSGGAGGRIAHCTSTGHVHIEDGSSPTVEWSDLGAALVIRSPHSRPLIRHNSIVVVTRSSIAFGVGHLAAPTVEHNEISWRDGAAICIGFAGGLVHDNIIRDSRTGIRVVAGGDPTIARNDVQARTTGILIADSRPVVTGNLLGASGGSGIVVARGATPALERNTSPWNGNPSVRATGGVA